ncbi:MAG: relaxase/mobilization nuclease domain-containing protein [Clostridia bacterium]|nr:relaxase/mobilization nuclease domain-containing protein [Clostridia bacterium]
MQFELVKRNNFKTGGKLGFHVIQSFSPGEVDYETAHRIGMELAEKIFEGRFQYVCATHIDRGHVHNHIIANSVSFIDGKKFYDQKKTMYKIREFSDEFCRENGLSVITKPKEKGRSQYEHSLDKKGKSWKSLLRKNIDEAILKTQSWDEFLLYMQKLKYEIKHGKYISFRAEGQKRFIRSKNLGTDYTEERLRDRISGARTNPTVSLIIDIENCFKEKQRNPEAFRQWATVQNLKTMANTVNYLTERNMLSYSALSEKHSALKEKYNADRSRIKEVERRLNVIAEDIKNIDNYRKHKPIADKLETVVFKEKYKREHESELIIFTAAEKYLKKRFDDDKAPLIKELRAEQKKLYAEKDRLYNSYNAAKSEIKEIDTVMKNVDMILGKDKEKSVQKQRTNELE